MPSGKITPHLLVASKKTIARPRVMLNFSHNLPSLFKMHDVWYVDSRKNINHSDFKAKMHQIRFWMGMCPKPHTESLQDILWTHSWIQDDLLVMNFRKGGGRGIKGEERVRENKGEVCPLNFQTKALPLDPHTRIHVGYWFVYTRGKVCYLWLPYYYCPLCLVLCCPLMSEY